MKTGSRMVRRFDRGVTAALLIAACAVAFVPASTAATAAVQASRPTTRRFGGMQWSSQYITMRDGVKLAADVYLPKGLAPGERTATVLHMTRYYRSIAFRALFRLFAGAAPYVITELDTRERLVKAGYSWVDVDVRGTGASFGRWTYPYSPDEVRDGADVINWITGQPWSAGAVAATGGSYDAGLAVLQLANDQPALKAVVSNFGAWDLYADVFAPGGISDTAFTTQFSDLMAAFDRNSLGDIFGFQASAAVSGVRPVDAALLPAAQAERAKNTNFARLAMTTEFQDDTDSTYLPGRVISYNDLSPNTVVGRRSRVPVLTYTGWFDGALQMGQIREFLATRAPGSRLRIGPWFHGIEFLNASPYGTSRKGWAGHADEVQRFLDKHLRGIDTGIDREAPVQYYAMGPEQWRTADTWPPPGTRQQSFFFGASQTLTTSAPPIAESSDPYEVDPASTSGGARWVLDMKTGRSHWYEDRRKISARLLHYTSAPLTAPVTVEGRPLVDVSISASAGDGGLFAYLEDVAPDGFVRYVTEGELRLLNRALSTPRDLFGTEPLHDFRRSSAKPMVPGRVESVVFDLLPTAYTFPAGHSIRIAIAGADAGVFKTPISAQPLIYQVHRDQMHPSRLDLPIR